MPPIGPISPPLPPECLSQLPDTDGSSIVQMGNPRLRVEALLRTTRLGSGSGGPCVGGEAPALLPLSRGPVWVQSLSQHSCQSLICCHWALSHTHPGSLCGAALSLPPCTWASLFCPCWTFPAQLPCLCPRMVSRLDWTLAEAGTVSRVLCSSDMTILPGPPRGPDHVWQVGGWGTHALCCPIMPWARSGSKRSPAKFWKGALSPSLPGWDGGSWVCCLPGEWYNQNHQVWSQREPENLFPLVKCSPALGLAWLVPCRRREALALLLVQHFWRLREGQV